MSFFFILHGVIVKFVSLETRCQWIFLYLGLFVKFDICSKPIIDSPVMKESSLFILLLPSLCGFFTSAKALGSVVSIWLFHEDGFSIVHPEKLFLTIELYMIA